MDSDTVVEGLPIIQLLYTKRYSIYKYYLISYWKFYLSPIVKYTKKPFRHCLDSPREHLSSASPTFHCPVVSVSEYLLSIFSEDVMFILFTVSNHFERDLLYCLFFRFYFSVNLCECSYFGLPVVLVHFMVESVNGVC